MTKTLSLTEAVLGWTPMNSLNEETMIQGGVAMYDVEEGCSVPEHDI